MALQMKKAVESTAKGVSGFREVVQDALVPELREIKAQISALKEELRLRTENLAQQDENLREELRRGDALLREQIRLGFEASARETKALSDKLDIALNIRERIVALEERLPRTQ